MRLLSRKKGVKWQQGNNLGRYVTRQNGNPLISLTDHGKKYTKEITKNQKFWASFT